MRFVVSAIIAMLLLVGCSSGPVVSDVQWTTVASGGATNLDKVTFTVLKPATCYVLGANGWGVGASKGVSPGTYTWGFTEEFPGTLPELDCHAR